MHILSCCSLALSLLAVSGPLQAQGLGALERAKILSADLDAADQFGSSVSLSAGSAVLGAPFDSDGVSLGGAAYVFVDSPSGWVEQAKLTPDDAELFNTFGESVGISGDTLVVGASGNGERGSFAGAAYVFTRVSGVWTQQAKLLAADGAPNDLFGAAVAIDGDTLVVGAYLDDDGGTNSGSAYVFVRNGGLWTQQAKLVPGDSMDRDSFGEALAIDGDTVLCGSRHNDDDGTSSGSAYIFVRTGSIWTQEAKLLAGDAGAFDTFGCSVSLSLERALVGACLDDGAGLNAGAAYVFLRTGTNWSQEQKLLSSNANAGDLFGVAVRLDGDRALVGASFSDAASDDLGSATVFSRTVFGWSESLSVASSDGASLDGFGATLALDGDSFMVGAPNHDLDPLSAVDTGAAYAYLIGPAATQATRSAGNNAQSLSAGELIIGSSVAFNVNLGLTGHTTAAVFAFSAPVSIPLSSGSVLLAGGSRLFMLPLTSGTNVNFSANVPNDLTLQGVTIYTQALHIFGVKPFVLSNALDMTAGF